jgi:short-subunit dehydrogenase
LQLSGAVALVTGASSGIGAATAVILSKAGARLVLTGRDGGRLDDVAERTGATAIPADLIDPDGPQRVVDAALAAEGRVDLLVCNAGVGWHGPITEMPGAKAAELVVLNLLAPVQFARLLAPRMAERGSGHMVFVSSIAGMTGVREEAVYAATKAGVNCLADSLVYELADCGIGVSIVAPGPVDTPFFSHRGSPYARRKPVPVPAELVARAIADAAARELPVVYVPGSLHFSAWLHGAAPGLFRELARRFGYRDELS